MEKSKYVKYNVLTGDRPTGKLHLGHYAGSLSERLRLQEIDECILYVMIADVQALTDYSDRPEYVVSSIREVMSDYLSVGLDPKKIVFFIQSQVTELAELTVYFLNLVTVSRLERNPTVKAEIQQKGFSESIPAGFLCYPVSQAADITAFQAEYVPVGADQAPLIEQTNEIVRTFNRLYKTNCLKEAKPIFGTVSRLMGIDGKSKASKSLKNAVFLSDSAEEIRRKVFAMYTDPNHLHISNKGAIEGNVVFQYLDAFHQDKEEVEELKAKYRHGGLGDTTVKEILNTTLQDFLTPIRERRIEIFSDLSLIESVLYNGTQEARRVANVTIRNVRSAIGIDGYFNQYKIT